MPRSLVNTTSPALASPRWAGDFGSRDYLLPGGATVEPSLFLKKDAVVVDVGAAGAGIGAVAVPVNALTGKIPSGTVLSFGGTKQAVLTADALAGAVSLTVAALPVALVDADVTTYPGIGKKVIPSGTVLGRTYAERDAGTGFGPAADADDEVYLNFFQIDDADSVSDVELYRGRGVVYENFLPVFSTLSATIKAKLRAFYTCSIGQV